MRWHSLADDPSVAYHETRDGLPPDCVPPVRRVQDNQVRGLANLDAIGVFDVQRAGSAAGNHPEHGILFVGSHHLGHVCSHMRNIQHAASAHRIPRVQNVIMSKTDIDSHLGHFFDSRKAAALGKGVKAALQMDVDQRVRNEIDAASCTKAQQLCSVCTVVAVHCSRMARRDHLPKTGTKRQCRHDLHEP